MRPTIFYEDAQILVCDKPAGMPVQPDRSISMDLVNFLKTHIHLMTEERPEVYLVHRLDRPVSGVMVFAKTKKAASFLSQEFQKKQSADAQTAFQDPQKSGLSKRYLAIIPGLLPVSEEIHTLTDYIKKDGRTNTSVIVSKDDADAKQAILHYRVLHHLEEQNLSLIEIDLVTGRHHQIRVQAAAHLGGIYGDRKYNPDGPGSQAPGYPALCSYFLSFFHPETGKKMHFEMYPGYGGFKLFAEYFDKKMK